MCKQNYVMENDQDLKNSLALPIPSQEKNLVLERTESDLSTTSQSTQNNISAGKYKVEFSDIALDKDPEDIVSRLSSLHKWYIALLVILSAMVITIISSCWTFLSPQISEKFHLKHEVSVLGISCYVWGLAFGPLFLSPISEMYGRRITFIFSLSMSIVWQCLTTWASNIEGMLFGRFLAGFFGSAFLSVAGGTISDLFNKNEVGVPMALFTTAGFLGPSIGPLLSGAMYHINYKWTFIVLLITSGVCLILVVLTVPETYKPVLLINKAKRLRSTTGDSNYYAPLENTRSSIPFWKAILFSIRRPFGLLFFDPMMGVLCFYSGFELAIIYLFFVAFPYVYPLLWNFNVMETACSYIGMMVGIILSAITSLYVQKRYLEKVKKNNGISIPEMRFEPLYIGAFLSPIGLMIFAWTCYSNVHWIAPIIGSTIFGMGVFYVFAGIFNYTVDAYRTYAASGLACNTFVRCILGGIFPLFGLQMFEGMTVNWAGFLLAMLAICLIPVPFLFDHYGAYLRSKSRYAYDG
ncbi:hypothetical protein TBLA_0A10350 [Henningerozyma blattae CBS 6284]|uniref:Major facilitator superfamily (MFS) profile domain-containing protein n=1 Tax=Henningerozyma blattae (strain ATCC 34711 / CBS 6284 / DSM 70876 / NBRC 10599 / NRRL Y-10934 / UCD 77-7) TaxID=1071380 RepID=I2GXG1_HENB6|nr:hypothetical protein TBLA_0A10350 [Tetrapisispora blattae CBS 6284]CCH58813.1 hypothetical protein TBLA_0A10350 [Tetrapisispora blattae CBS 6284]